MPGTVIVGAQWGDEGKGKIVDLLADRFEIVARYQGGSNAGHTVVVGDDRVPRVRAAVVAADEIGVLREQVDDLALALVAPLGADDDGAGHARSLSRPGR